MRKEWNIKELLPNLDGTNEILYNAIPRICNSVGIIYGSGKLNNSNGEGVFRSADNWGIVTPLVSLPKGSGKISSMYMVSDTVIMVGTSFGQLFRFASPFSAVTKVMQMTTVGAYPVSWSWTSKGNLVFVSEYGWKGDTNNSRRVYKSPDAGVTWAEVYQIPQVSGTHIHKILLDPYTDILWVSNGDTVPRLTKLDPPDYTVGTVISTAIQPTWGIVFEDYILWIQDNAPSGVYKMLKSDNSLSLVLNLATDFPSYRDTAYGAITDPTGRVFYATHPDVYNSLPCGFFTSDPPHDNWELICEIKGLQNHRIGITHFVKADINGVIAVYSGSSFTNRRTVYISKSVRV